MNAYDNISVNKHVVAESSLLKATEVGHILSMKCAKDLNNGSIVTRGNFVEEQVFETADYAAGKKPYLVLTTPIGYNSDRKYYQDEQWFYNAQGEIARCYELHVDDVFTVSENAISGSPEVGKYVEVDGALYKAVAAAPQTGIVMRVIEQVNHTNGKAYRIHVESLGM